MDIPAGDREALIRDKYDGDRSADITDDLARLSAGEPLAYVIGWIPFLGVHIDLSSRPLIPRPETEYWTEVLIKHLGQKYGDSTFSFLDLCAGSGAIGCAVKKALPNAKVFFGEIDEQHVEQIKRNIERSALDIPPENVRTSDLFAAFSGMTFDVVASNPPYVPDARELPHSVVGFEPARALFAGSDGLSLIQRIAVDAPQLVTGELWLECDSEHIEEVAKLLNGAIHEDQYGRGRYVVSYYE